MKNVRGNVEQDVWLYTDQIINVQIMKKVFWSVEINVEEIVWDNVNASITNNLWLNVKFTKPTKSQVNKAFDFL